ncbi:MAG: universal stress protein [Nakamurella sp.]
MSDPAVNLSRYVVVAVDGSEASREALREGHRMAELLGAPLAAVTSWHLSRGLFPPTSWTPEPDAELLLTDSIREAFRGMHVPVVHHVTVNGAPAESLIKLSADAALLVLGSRGHSGIAGVMLGSVSSVCAAHALCPVLIVHPPAARTVVAAQDADSLAPFHAAV